MNLKMTLIKDKDTINDRISYEIQHLDKSKRDLARYVAKIKFINSNIDNEIDFAFHILNQLVDYRYDYIHAEYNANTEELKVYHKDLIALKLLIDTFIIMYFGLEERYFDEENSIKYALNEITDLMWENNILIDGLKALHNIKFDKITLYINSELLTEHENNAIDIYDITDDNIHVNAINSLIKVMNDYNIHKYIMISDKNETLRVIEETFHYIAALYNYVLDNK